MAADVGGDFVSFGIIGKSPDKAAFQKDKVIGRIRELRGGKLNDPNFNSRMRAEGPYADHMRRLFEVSCRKAGMNAEKPALTAEFFRRPGPAQPRLF